MHTIAAHVVYSGGSIRHFQRHVRSKANVTIECARGTSRDELATRHVAFAAQLPWIYPGAYSDNTNERSAAKARGNGSIPYQLQFVSASGDQASRQCTCP